MCLAVQQLLPRQPISMPRSNLPPLHTAPKAPQQHMMIRSILLNPRTPPTPLNNPQDRLTALITCTETGGPNLPVLRGIRSQVAPVKSGPRKGGRASLGAKGDQEKFSSRHDGVVAERSGVGPLVCPPERPLVTVPPRVGRVYCVFWGLSP